MDLEISVDNTNKGKFDPVLTQSMDSNQHETVPSPKIPETIPPESLSREASDRIRNSYNVELVRAFGEQRDLDPASIRSLSLEPPKLPDFRDLLSNDFPLDDQIENPPAVDKVVGLNLKEFKWDTKRVNHLEGAIFPQQEPKSPSDAWATILPPVLETEETSLFDLSEEQVNALDNLLPSRQEIQTKLALENQLNNAKNTESIVQVVKAMIANVRLLEFYEAEIKKIEEELKKLHVNEALTIAKFDLLPSLKVQAEFNQLNSAIQQKEAELLQIQMKKVEAQYK